MPEQQTFTSIATKTALSTSYTSLDIGVAGPTGPGPAGFPDRCFVSHVSLELDTIVTAATVSWYLCEDSAGDIPLTNVVTTNIVDEGSGSAEGGFGALVGMAYERSAQGTKGSLYLRAKLNAGTANAIGKLRVEVG